MYSMAIGLSSRSVLLFGLGLFQGIIFSAAYGALVHALANAAPGHTPHLERADMGSCVAIILIMLFHIVERYNRHVVDEAPFFEFSLTSKNNRGDGNAG